MKKYQFVSPPERLRRVSISKHRRTDCWDFRIEGISGRLITIKRFWKGLDWVRGCYWNNYGRDTGLDFVRETNNRLEILILTGFTYESLIERVSGCICSDCGETKRYWTTANGDENSPLCMDCTIARREAGRINEKV